MTQEELNKIVENHQHYLNRDVDNWEDLRANLCRADLSFKNLKGINLAKANLRGVNFKCSNLVGAILIDADLSDAMLAFADLDFADLCNSNLSGANLNLTHSFETNFKFACLNNSSLNSANLVGANLYGAKLNNADLTKSDLSLACLRGAELNNTNFKHVELYKTTFDKFSRKLLAMDEAIKNGLVIKTIAVPPGETIKETMAIVKMELPEFSYRMGWDKSKSLELIDGEIKITFRTNYKYIATPDWVRKEVYGVEDRTIKYDKEHNRKVYALNGVGYYFANGGFPDHGDVFIANEAGPELVGSIGNKTTVANQQQIVTAVSQGVAEGVSNANREQNTLLKQQNELLLQLLAKQGNTTITTSQLKSAFNQDSRRSGRVGVATS